MKKIGIILLLICALTSCNGLDNPQDYSSNQQDEDEQTEVQLTQEEIDLIESLLQEVGEE